MNNPRISHPAVVPIVDWRRVTGINSPVPVYAPTCAVCGRKVRQMTGLGGPNLTVFHHAGGVPKGTKR